MPCDQGITRVSALLLFLFACSCSRLCAQLTLTIHVFGLTCQFASSTSLCNFANIAARNALISLELMALTAVQFGRMMVGARWPL